MKNLILASGSPRRRELMELAGLDFEVITSDADENISGLSPEETVRELARRKAMAVAKGLAGVHTVIGADTIVVYDNKIIGKPKDEEEAFKMLKGLSGDTHQVFTGVCIIKTGASGCTERDSFVSKTDVTFHPLTDDEISGYIATGEPMDKAGAYGIQGKGSVLVAGIKGDFYCVMGLPISELYRRLKGLETTDIFNV